jgi:hypothetical protein
MTTLVERRAEARTADTLTTALPPVPEPGQVVNVRGSTWAVADVREQGLPSGPADDVVARLSHV